MTSISDVSAKNSNPQQTVKTNGSVNVVGKALSTGNVGPAASDTYSAQELKKQAQIKELINEIDNLCDKLGTTSTQIFSVLGQNIENEEILTVEICNKRLEALKAAIKDATINGQLDKEKAIKLAKDYTIALNTGWSIEGLKKQNKACGEISLKERLIQIGYLKKNVEPSSEELEVAIKRFFNDFFNVKIKNAKTPQEKAKVIKQQMQTFGRLLINTKGEEREMFTKVIANLIQENRLEGTKNVFLSTVDDKQKQKMALDLHNSMREIFDGLSDDDSIQVGALAVMNLSKEDKIKLPSEIELLRQEFQKKYSEADIKAVIDLYNKKSFENIPEQYREALKDYIFIVNMSSGEKIGLGVIDTNFTDLEHFNINKELDVNLSKFGIDTYKAIQVKTAEVVEKHPEVLNMSREEFVEFMDKVSDGQFSTIVKESGVVPSLIKGDATSSTGVGVVQNSTQETYWSTLAALDEKINELYIEQQKDENKFYVVAPNNKKDENTKSPWKKFQTVKGLSAKDLVDGIANKYLKINVVLDKYNELTQSAKDFVNNLVKSMSTGVQNYVLNAVKGDTALDIVKAVRIDISKLNLNNLTYDQAKIAESLKKKKDNQA